MRYFRSGYFRFGYFRPGYFPGMTPSATPEPVPATFAAALVAIYRSRPELVALAPRIAQGQRGDRDKPPVVIFRIERSPTFRTTDVSLWREARVIFECLATTVEDAEDLRDAVAAAFKRQTFDWQGGYSIPLVPADGGAMIDKQRAGDNARVARAVAQFSARCREER